MSTCVSFDAFAHDPNLAGGVLGRASYAPIVAVVKAALAEPLSPSEREHFDRLAGGRELPSDQVAELAIVAGRGAGKSQTASALLVHLATCRTWPVDPGQVPTALLLAADREQAQVSFRYVLGLLEASPVLRQEIDSSTKDRIALRSGVEIQVGTSDFRAVRGRSFIAVICDELSFWPTTPDSASPDREVLIAVRPGLARFRGSLLVAISTPFAQQGELYEFYRRAFGQNDPRALVIRGGTRDFNPTFPQQVIDEAMATDPAAALAEYCGEFRTDVASFIDPQLVDSLTRSEPRELPRRIVSADGGSTGYVAGLDVSGGRGDAAAVAVAHRERDHIIVDAVRRWPAPHDPADVARQVAEFLQGYGLASARADQFGAELARTIYAQSGIALVAAEHTRSDSYLRLLPLMTTGRVELPPHPHVRLELIGLVRRTARGRDVVDHRPGAHDDTANALALAAVAAAQQGDTTSAAIWFEPSEFEDGYAGVSAASVNPQFLR